MNISLILSLFSIRLSSSSFLLPPSSSSPDGECWDEHLDRIIELCVLVSVIVERAVC